MRGRRSGKEGHLMHNGRTTEADEIRLLDYSAEWTPCDVAEVKRQSEGLRNRTFYVGREAGRNEPCPCGSGKKYKRCCMRGKQA
jgi:uncharacterized protein YecA (UPF0149 family)